MTDRPIFGPEPEPYYLADTQAAKMLAQGFDRLWNEQGISQRQLAPKLGYRNSVPLSHMALGRIPVPVEKVAALSRLLNIDEGDLLLAVLEQRHPAVRMRELLSTRSARFA